MDKRIIKRAFQVLLSFGLSAVLIFASAGDWSWMWGWLYVACSILILAVNLTVMPRELIAERGETKRDAKRWDRIVTSATIPFLFSSWIVAGLDQRFGWSKPILMKPFLMEDGKHLAPLELIVHLTGMFLYLGGSALFTWSMVSNRFFTTMVRIQKERGHSVATDGPYRIVRHPGYLGYIVYTAGVPLLLGSLWAEAPVVGTATLFIVRTALEDRTLRAELPGYEEYATKVRFRLIPGIW